MVYSTFKKISIILILSILCISISYPSFSVEIPTTFSNNILVLERNSGSILYEKNGFQKISMASTTKIMTCIIALENSNLTDSVVISKNVSKVQGSKLGIKSGSTISMHDLLYGLMLKSGNDCAIAIAEHVSGSTEKFATLMNEKATCLGLLDTHFITPHGLDNTSHYTTAYDLALLTNYALNNDVFYKIVSTKEKTIFYNNTSNTIHNTNELLDNFDGIYGVKTGFTFNAGRCLVTACKRNNLDVICVVLKADTKNIRTRDSKNILNYIFDNYSFYNFENEIKNVLHTLNNDANYFLIEKSQTLIYPILKENSNIKTKFFINKHLIHTEKSPFIIGKLYLYNNNSFITSINIIYNKEYLKEKNLKSFFKLLFNLV